MPACRDSPGADVPSAVGGVVVDAGEQHAVDAGHALRAEHGVRGAAGRHSGLHTHSERRREGNSMLDLSSKALSGKW